MTLLATIWFSLLSHYEFGFNELLKDDFLDILFDIRAKSFGDMQAVARLMLTFANNYFQIAITNDDQLMIRSKDGVDIRPLTCTNEKQIKFTIWLVSHMFSL